MSEWDKLCEEKMEEILVIMFGDLSHEILCVTDGDTTTRKIKALLLDLVQEVKTEDDRMQKQLGETQFQLSCAHEALSKTFNKLADEQRVKDSILTHHVSQEEGMQKQIDDQNQKLEAIRAKLVFEPSYVSVAELAREIREVLGDE